MCDMMVENAQEEISQRTGSLERFVDVLPDLPVDQHPPRNSIPLDILLPELSAVEAANTFASHEENWRTFVSAVTLPVTESAKKLTGMSSTPPASKEKRRKIKQMPYPTKEKSFSPFSTSAATLVSNAGRLATDTDACLKATDRLFSVLDDPSLSQREKLELLAREFPTQARFDSPVPSFRHRSPSLSSSDSSPCCCNASSSSSESSSVSGTPCDRCPRTPSSGSSVKSRTTSSSKRKLPASCFSSSHSFVPLAIGSVPPESSVKLNSKESQLAQNGLHFTKSVEPIFIQKRTLKSRPKPIPSGTVPVDTAAVPDSGIEEDSGISLDNFDSFMVTAEQETALDDLLKELGAAAAEMVT